MIIIYVDLLVSQGTFLGKACDLRSSSGGTFHPLGLKLPHVKNMSSTAL